MAAAWAKAKGKKSKGDTKVERAGLLGGDGFMEMRGAAATVKLARYAGNLEVYSAAATTLQRRARVMLVRNRSASAQRLKAVQNRRRRLKNSLANEDFTYKDHIL